MSVLQIISKGWQKKLSALKFCGAVSKEYSGKDEKILAAIIIFPSTTNTPSIEWD